MYKTGDKVVVPLDIVSNEANGWVGVCFPATETNWPGHVFPVPVSWLNKVKGYSHENKTTDATFNIVNSEHLKIYIEGEFTFFMRFIPSTEGKNQETGDTKITKQEITEIYISLKKWFGQYYGPDCP